MDPVSFIWLAFLGCFIYFIVPFVGEMFIESIMLFVERIDYGDFRKKNKK